MRTKGRRRRRNRDSRCMSKADTARLLLTQWEFLNGLSLRHGDSNNAVMSGSLLLSSQDGNDSATLNPNSSSPRSCRCCMSSSRANKCFNYHHRTDNERQEPVWFPALLSRRHEAVCFPPPASSSCPSVETQEKQQSVISDDAPRVGGSHGCRCSHTSGTEDVAAASSSSDCHSYSSFVTFAAESRPEEMVRLEIPQHSPTSSVLPSPTAAASSVVGEAVVGGASPTPLLEGAAAKLQARRRQRYSSIPQGIVSFLGPPDIICPCDRHERKMTRFVKWASDKEETKEKLRASRHPTHRPFGDFRQAFPRNANDWNAIDAKRGRRVRDVYADCARNWVLYAERHQLVEATASSSSLHQAVSDIHRRTLSGKSRSSSSVFPQSFGTSFSERGPPPSGGVSSLRSRPSLATGTMRTSTNLFTEGGGVGASSPTPPSSHMLIAAADISPESSVQVDLLERTPSAAQPTVQPTVQPHSFQKVGQSLPVFASGASEGELMQGRIAPGGGGWNDGGYYMPPETLLVGLSDSRLVQRDNNNNWGGYTQPPPAPYHYPPPKAMYAVSGWGTVPDVSPEQQYAEALTMAQDFDQATRSVHPAWQQQTYAAFPMPFGYPTAASHEAKLPAFSRAVGFLDGSTAPTKTESEDISRERRKVEKKKVEAAPKGTKSRDTKLLRVPSPSRSPRPEKEGKPSAQEPNGDADARKRKARPPEEKRPAPDTSASRIKAKERVAEERRTQLLEKTDSTGVKSPVKKEPSVIRVSPSKSGEPATGSPRRSYEKTDSIAARQPPRAATAKLKRKEPIEEEPVPEVVPERALSETLVAAGSSEQRPEEEEEGKKEVEELEEEEEEKEEKKDVEELKEEEEEASIKGKLEGKQLVPQVSVIEEKLHEAVTEAEPPTSPKPALPPSTPMIPLALVSSGPAPRQFVVTPLAADGTAKQTLIVTADDTGTRLVCPIESASVDAPQFDHPLPKLPLATSLSVHPTEQYHPLRPEHRHSAAAVPLQEQQPLWRCQGPSTGAIPLTCGVVFIRNRSARKRSPSPLWKK